MKLTPVTVEEAHRVPKYRHDAPCNDVLGTLNQFLTSGKEAALVEVTPGDYQSVHSAFSSFYKAIKTKSYPVRAELRSGSLYLYRTNI